MIATSNTYRFIAIILAAVLFVTSVGITMDMHYCKGELKSISLFGKAQIMPRNSNYSETVPHITKR